MSSDVVNTVKTVMFPTVSANVAGIGELPKAQKAGQDAYDSVVKGQTPEKPDLGGSPTAVPTPDNSDPALSEEAKRQRQAKGAAATIFGGASGVMSSGSPQSQRMMLGS